MTIILDDVSRLLLEPIHGKLFSHHAKISQEQGAYLITHLLGVDPDYVAADCDNMKDAHM
ncbi:hypothetical protein MtrunA17_Chr2g0289171 [Medicago truncatula]|uniref:Uncharacterized protein n=1 Tax=Medicago truncatula TaxID=3880 RepID=A0A396J7S6_MEDTR|nr:hypothetical protein MtrunA17_Chr2g0289171 [Medicago truncatula]